MTALKLHPQFLLKNGRSQFVILSYEEFQAIQEQLEDAADVLALRKAREEDDPARPGYSIEQFRVMLGLNRRKKSRRTPPRRR